MIEKRLHERLIDFIYYRIFTSDLKLGINRELISIKDQLKIVVQTFDLF